MLGPRRPPGMIELKALITEISFAVGTTLGGLQSLRRLTELAHHSNISQTHRVPVSMEVKCNSITHFIYSEQIRHSLKLIWSDLNRCVKKVRQFSETKNDDCTQSL